MITFGICLPKWYWYTSTSHFSFLPGWPKVSIFFSSCHMCSINTGPKQQGSYRATNRNLWKSVWTENVPSKSQLFCCVTESCQTQRIICHVRFGRLILLRFILRPVHSEPLRYSKSHSFLALAYLSCHLEHRELGICYFLPISRKKTQRAIVNVMTVLTSSCFCVVIFISL